MVFYGTSLLVIGYVNTRLLVCTPFVSKADRFIICLLREPIA